MSKENAGDAWDSAWGEAAKLALEFHPPIPDSLGHIRQLVTTLYLLSLAADGKPFPVPVARIAESIGKNTTQAGNIRGALCKMKFLLKSDDVAPPERGKADTFEFTAQVVRGNR